MTLADEDMSVVDGLGKAELVHAGLETALQEVLDLEGQDVIELQARLVEDTDTDETANEGIAFDQTLGVLLVEGEELTAGGKKPLANFFLPCIIRGLAISYRAARRILDSVRPTRHTSRLLRRPYSPTSFSSESLLHRSQF